MSDTNNNTPAPKFKDVKSAMKRYNQAATESGLTHDQSRAARRGRNAAYMVGLIATITGLIALGLLSAAIVILPSPASADGGQYYTYIPMARQSMLGKPTAFLPPTPVKPEPTIPASSMTATPPTATPQPELGEPPFVPAESSK